MQPTIIMQLTEAIQEEDWSPIDADKAHSEKGLVSCESVEELEHLISFFKKHYPEKTEKEIIYAIADCWRSVTSSQPRTIFIARVASKL